MYEGVDERNGGGALKSAFLKDIVSVDIGSILAPRPP